MYKILFVDDEQSVLEYLPMAIDWNALGITKLYTASDAQQALSIVKSAQPDIAIVDVEMPGKDGLEFCKEAQKLHPQLRFVILSAFDRFDYAKKAIVIGVDDYLLKPVDEQELMRLMKKIVGDLSKLRRNHQENQSMQLQSLKKEAGELLQALLRDKTPSRELDTDFPLLKEYENLCLAMQGNQDAKSCREALEHDMGAECLFTPLMEGFYLALWRRNRLVSMEQRVDNVRQKLEQENFHVWLSYVQVQKGETHSQALIRCFYGLEGMFYATKEKKRPWESPAFGEIRSQMPDLREGLRVLSEDGNVSVLQKEIYRTLEDAFARRGEPVKICNMLLDVFTTVKMYLTEYWKQETMNTVRQIDIGILMRCGTPENLYKMVERHLGELQFFVRNQQKKHSNFYIVSIAKEYTREHYQDKALSLQEVADATGISRTYFSKIFKEMTGEKYWDYLSRYRIQRAKELLRGTNQGQAEISEQVGYGSQFHFSRKFKEIVGLSPNQFRKK